MKKLLIFLSLFFPVIAWTQSYPYFAPGGALSCAGACTQQSVNLASGSFITNTLPAANIPPVAANSIVANNTSSPASQVSLKSVDVACMISAVSAVKVASPTNIVTLSGVQTVDTISGSIGEPLLLTAESSQINNGPWIMQSGTWTRPTNFQTGDVIPALCVADFLVEQGPSFGGTHLHLNTTAIITVGSSGLTFSDVTIPAATSTVRGTVTVTDTGSPVAAMTASPTNIGGAIFDCPFFQTANGSIGDGNGLGNFGPCALTDSNGHLLTTNASGSPPTSSAGTIDPTSTDNNGRITGIVATTSITITFKGSFSYTPRCGGSTSTPALGAVVSVPTGTVSPTSVTFVMASLTGSFNYWCW